MAKLAIRDRALKKGVAMLRVMSLVEHTSDQPSEQTLEDPAIAACRSALDAGFAPEFAHLEEKVRERLAHLRACENDEVKQYEERKKCRESIEYFLTWYGWGYDPRIEEGSKRLPFIPWSKQVEFLDFVKEKRLNRKEGAVEKSRDAGATFLAAGYALHGFLFENDFAAGFTSETLDKIDKSGDPLTIFYKIRSILYALPRWLMPIGFTPRLHDGYLKIINPQNRSTIMGMGGDNPGRAGRFSIFFVDEAAHVPKTDLVDRSLSGATRTIIWISTPNGIGNLFYRKVHQGKVDVFTFDWRDDPRTNAWILRNPDGSIFAKGNGRPQEEVKAGMRLSYPWYEQLKADKDEVTVAQEYDRDYAASIEGTLFEAKWIRAARGLRLPGSAFRSAGYDIAEWGRNKSAFIVREGPRVPVIEQWAKMSTWQGAKKVITLCITHRVNHLSYDRGGGYGGALAGKLEDIKDSGGKFEGHRVTFTYQGINVGLAASKRSLKDGRRADEVFANIKADEFDKLARRFEKTWEYVVEGVDHPLDELIALPASGEDVDILERQLLTILKDTNEANKMILESKKHMKKRGVESPDLADALVLAFMDRPVTSRRSKTHSQ